MEQRTPERQARVVPRKRVVSWRTERIERFSDRQRRERAWINFGEIAEWCSEEAGIAPNETLRLHAYLKLKDDLLNGFFDENGRSRILLLNPETSLARMTRYTFSKIVEGFTPEANGLKIIISAYLEHCWIPRHLFHHWLDYHRLPAAPSRFEPRSEQLKTKTRPTDKRRRPSRELALRAIDALFQTGVPDQTTLPNAKLCSQVGNWLKGQKLDGVSDDTILRAAGRRQ